MARNGVNEVYQYNLRVEFLEQLQETCPTIAFQLKNDIFNFYKSAFVHYSDNVKYAQLEDVLENRNYFVSTLEKLKEAIPKEKLKIEYLPETFEFAQKFIIWLDFWNLKEEWLADHFLNLLRDWKKYPKEIENEKLYNFLTVAYFESFGKAFSFNFRSMRRDETIKNYSETLDKSFQSQKRFYLEEMKNQAKIIPISKNKESLHIQWFIEYYVKQPTKTSKKIALESQLKGEKATRQAVEKAVKQISFLLPLHPKNAT